MVVNTNIEYSPEVLSFFEDNEIFDDDAIEILVNTAMAQFGLISKEEFNDRVLEELGDGSEREILPFIYELIR